MKEWINVKFDITSDFHLFTFLSVFIKDEPFFYYLLTGGVLLPVTTRVAKELYHMDGFLITVLKFEVIFVGLAIIVLLGNSVYQNYFYYPRYLRSLASAESGESTKVSKCSAPSKNNVETTHNVHTSKQTQLS